MHDLLMSLEITEDLQIFIQSYKPQIEAELQKLFPFSNTPQEKLFEAARYTLFTGGKRLRPLLVLAAVKTCRGKVEEAFLPACAIELIHTYSLVHDDLPCMDNDDFRRGKPTLHKQYDEATALLTGDYLLTYAFELLAKSPHLDAEQKVSLIETLASAAGSYGMIGGQVLDIWGKIADLKFLENIYLRKTADLISASLCFGGIISHVSFEMLHTLKQFGQEIGLAFQIVDDIIDVTSPQKKHGRAISSDSENGKVTYVSLMGKEKAQELAFILFEQSLKRLDVFEEKELLKEFAHLMICRRI